MELTEDGIREAPTRIRRVWEIVANPQLDTFHVPISSQLKGIEIELFPSIPDKDTAMLLCIKNSILRDIRIDREKVDEKNWSVRLRFSLGISWDPNVWKWGEDYVFMECYAKFSQSQSELFDDNAADDPIERPRTAAEMEAIEEIAHELADHAPQPTETPAIDPLLVGARKNGTHPRTRKKKALPLAEGKSGAQPHA